jgi:hypothetical protein
MRVFWAPWGVDTPLRQTAKAKLDAQLFQQSDTIASIKPRI